MREIDVSSNWFSPSVWAALGLFCFFRVLLFWHCFTVWVILSSDTQSKIFWNTSFWEEVSLDLLVRLAPPRSRSLPSSSKVFKPHYKHEYLKWQVFYLFGLGKACVVCPISNVRPHGLHQAVPKLQTLPPKVKESSLNFSSVMKKHLGLWKMHPCTVLVVYLRFVDSLFKGILPYFVI